MSDAKWEPSKPKDKRKALGHGRTAQALCLAFGREHGKNTYSWVEELFDYENQLGVAAGCQAGLIKARFNGSDFATVVCPTYAVAK
jgi:hypothetical protein